MGGGLPPVRRRYAARRTLRAPGSFSVLTSGVERRINVLGSSLIILHTHAEFWMMLPLIAMPLPLNIVARNIPLMRSGVHFFSLSQLQAKRLFSRFFESS